MTLLGNLALWLALLLGLWGTVAGALGAGRGRRDLANSAERASRATAGVLGIALGALAVAVFRNDFNVAYVAAHGGRALSGWYRWAVLYAGPEGVALVYATALAVSALLTSDGREVPAGALRAALTGAVVACVAAALVFLLNPFARLPFTPVDGGGLDPRLQHAAGALAPPLLLVAYAALTVPCASVIAGLASRRPPASWVGGAHRWTLSAWLLLSAGTLLGGRAAYVESGASQGWFARPAVLGALIVWVAVTLLLHATAAEQRRGTIPRWSLVFTAGSWALAALATGATTADAVGPAAIALAVSGGVLAASVAWWFGRRVTDAGGAPPARETGGLRGHRAAAHVTHVGAALLAIASAGAAWHREARVELQPGGTTTLASPFGSRYELTYLGTSRYERSNQIVTAATIEASRAGRRLGVRRAEQLLYVDVMGRQVGSHGSRAALWGGVVEDMRVELLMADEVGETAVLRVALNPLVAWVWAGGGLLLLGGLLAVQGSFTRPSRDRG